MKNLFIKTAMIAVIGYALSLIIDKVCSFDDFTFELDNEDSLFI